MNLDALIEAGIEDTEEYQEAMDKLRALDRIYGQPKTCSEETLCPDDSIRPCIKPHGHDGWHDAGVR